MPSVDVSEIGFTGDPIITRWADGVDIDKPDGSAPTWKKTGNPNHPVTYKRGTNPTMFAKLKITPALTTNMPVTLYVWEGTNLIATKPNVVLTGSEVQVTAITTSVALEETTKTATHTLRWELIHAGGFSPYPIGISGPHLIHWTWGPPISLAFRNDAGVSFLPLFDLAFEKACGGANGATTLDQVISNICEGVRNDVFYDPEQGIGGLHPLNAYSAPEGCQCSD